MLNWPKKSVHFEIGEPNLHCTMSLLYPCSELLHMSKLFGDWIIDSVSMSAVRRIVSGSNDEGYYYIISLLNSPETRLTVKQKETTKKDHPRERIIKPQWPSHVLVHTGGGFAL